MSATILVFHIDAAQVAGGLYGVAADGGLALRRFAMEPIVRRGPGLESDWVLGAGAALGAIARREGFRGACRIGLPGESTLLRIVRTPLACVRSLDCAAGFEARQHIPLPLDQVVWDHLPIQMEDGYCDVLLAALRLKIADGICAAARRAGLTPVALEPSGFALLQAQRRYGLSGSIVASIGARSTNLAFSADERFCIHTIGIGGDDLADRGTAANHIVEEFSRRLRGEIARFRFQAAELLRVRAADAAIYLAGGGAALPALIESLGRSLRVSPLVAGGDARVPPELFGLATVLVDDGRPSLNLLPAEFACATRVRRRQPALLAAAALVAVAPLPVTSHLHSEAARLREQADWAGRRAIALSRLESQKRVLGEEVSALQREAEAMRLDLSRRERWLRLFEGGRSEK